jgi:acetoin utilization protein AcuB
MQSGATLKVADVMTANTHTVGAEQSLALARRLMSQHDVRHLPVLHGGALVGLVSERDIAIVEALGGVDPAQVRVEEAMSEPYVVTPQASVVEVAKTMAHRKLGSAIVSARGTEVLGIFTTIDALHLLVVELEKR